MCATTLVPDLFIDTGPISKIGPVSSTIIKSSSTHLSQPPQICLTDFLFYIGGDSDPMSLAVSPLAIPLTLYPVGIVILVIASVEVQDLTTAALIIGMILVIALIDLGVLYSAGRIAKYLSHATVELLKRVLGILLGALAVELIVVGLATLGIISITSH